MYPELNYTNEEKEIINEWKMSLPAKPDRTFAYMFIGNGRRNNEWEALYNHVLASNDGFKLTLVKNITLG